MRMDRAFWPAGCARSVNDHHWIFGGCALGRRVIKRPGQFCRRSRIRAEIFDEPFAGLVENDEMPQRWNLCGRMIGDRFHRAKFPASIRSGSGEERFCVGVV